MKDDTASLVNEASRGDAAAVERLLERFLPELRGFIRLRAGAVIRDREDVADIAQSVCREVLQDLGRFAYTGEAAFKHWLYTTALRVIQNRAKYWARDKRDVKREVRADSLAGGPSAQEDLLRCYRSLATPSVRLQSAEEVQRIESAFERLTEDHREVITLARVIGLSHAEIAARMGRSEQATRALLHRALATLALLLEQQDTKNAAPESP